MTALAARTKPSPEPQGDIGFGCVSGFYSDLGTQRDEKRGRPNPLIAASNMNGEMEGWVEGWRDGGMEHKQDFLTAVPTAWPGSHPSPSLHPSLMEEGREIPLHSSARVNGGLGPSATGILAGSRQLGSHSSLLLTVQELGKGRAGSSSGADFCSPRSPKAHSWDSWDFLPPGSTAPGSAYLHPLQTQLTWTLTHLQLARIAALERRGEIKGWWSKFSVYCAS